MKILLDENLPKRLKYEFLETQIFTVRDKGWQGTKNSKLLAKMVEENFNVLITFDKQMRYQQNFDSYPICAVVLNAQSNSYHSSFFNAFDSKIEKRFISTVTTRDY